MWCSQVGDGTTSVVLIAGEILKNCKPFVEDGVHPQIIARGLRKAIQLALTKLREIAVHVKKEDPKWVERRKEREREREWERAREWERRRREERGSESHSVYVCVCVCVCLSVHLAVSECQEYTRFFVWSSWFCYFSTHLLPFFFSFLPHSFIPHDAS